MGGKYLFYIPSSGGKGSWQHSNNENFSVVLDDSGFSKGFGFIRFNNETEQQTALTSMMGVSGLGGKPLKVNLTKGTQRKFIRDLILIYL